MSQQLTQQQWVYQFRPDADYDQARTARRRADPPGLSRHNLRNRSYLRLSPAVFTLAAMGLTASLLALAILYVSANAFAAKTEYQRQRLQRETALLRDENAALRCQLDQAANLDRVRQFALAANMRPADPASETDFLSFTPAQSRTEAQGITWFNNGPMLIAALARQLGGAYPSDRAEASPSDAEASRR
ncbi:MAG: hypothetical protein GTO55_10675 [Armatimonadetes bacterium]|nr:hypothetical protein [Armatimonadota bacterium]NIM24696.1 hypothetical protein [Armatimonadota bacterium]NIM68576.1 hypothetical protein [Armatimonadota bacterium]NIM77093.1 hypothetical protein [Armatimonadota bacterium]NIN06770.1 hypothetical protein [Armatimonadota bacterium]